MSDVEARLAVNSAAFLCLCEYPIGIRSDDFLNAGHLRSGASDKLHDPSLTSCPNCQMCSLSAVETPAKIFGTRAVVDASIYEQFCSACSHLVSFDGSEAFILRKAQFSSAVLGKFELCFDWDLLYSTLDDVVDGTHWYTCWTRMMQSYLRDGVPHKQLISMQSMYRHFREASMDFADLWSVDFWAHLRYECVDSTATIMADGITISCLNSSLHLLKPWLPKQPNAGEALVPSQRGSDYGQRFAIDQR
jgi:hypothetical protein